MTDTIGMAHGRPPRGGRMLALLVLCTASLAGTASAGAAVITRTVSLDLEIAYNPPTLIPEKIQSFLEVGPAFALLPGDTLEVQVTFQNGQRLRLEDAPTPVADSPICSPYFSYPLASYGGPTTIEMDFTGVTGSLLVNPAVMFRDCTDICYGLTPDLTNTSFEFEGFVARLTPLQEAVTVIGAGFYCKVPLGADLAVVGPIPVDPPQPVPSGGAPLEYSNDADETVDSFLGTTLEVHGPPDPGQTLYTEPIDVAGNLLPDIGGDFFPAVETGTEITQQVDALAYGNDAYLARLFIGEADLLFSVTGDGADREWALLREETDGTLSVEYFHTGLVSGDGPGGLDDLDAAELWGGLGALDAHYYSLRADAVSGTSVFVQVNGVPVPFVTHAEILSAVMSLGYLGDRDQVDVDGMMVRNAGVETRFDTGDVLLFSVHATPDGNFDGGEIIELRPGQPAKFFEHGGHAWDTAFDLTVALNPLNGGVDPVGAEDVDALEATLASWLVGLTTGRVPDGSGPEPPLTVVREQGGDLTLSWGPSCAAGDVDYEIYAGTIGSYYSHAPVVCSTGGATTLTIAAPPGDAYFLVAPDNGAYEGSYGWDSAGNERPAGGPSCLQPDQAVCAP